MLRIKLLPVLEVAVLHLVSSERRPRKQQRQDDETAHQGPCPQWQAFPSAFSRQ